jgi:lipoprotein-releasing system permease protein
LLKNGKKPAKSFLQPIFEKDKYFKLKVAGFIANRIAFNQQKSFSRFIIRLSIVATVISVAVMIITISLANGFQQTVSQKVFSFLGHIRVQENQPEKAIISEETSIIHNASLMKLISEKPEVESIHPYASKYAILKTKDDMEGVLIKGFDKNFNYKHLLQFIKEGRPIQYNDSTYSREIIISNYTAEQLHLKLNDKILVYFIRPGKNENEDGTPNIRPDKLTVTGIYKTSIEEYDKIFAIGDIQLIQRLNGWRTDEIGGYEIFLKDYKKIDLAAIDIHDMDKFPQTWNTVSARDLSPNIFDWLNIQDKNRNILIVIMLIVAIINLVSCLIILVLERTKMVGILKALGATNWTVQKIFIRHSLFITLTGIALGALFGLGLLWLQEATGFIKLKEEAYYMSTAAVKIVWWQIAVICAGTLAICFLVLMLPSILVRKVQPVKAIQFR